MPKRPFIIKFLIGFLALVPVAMVAILYVSDHQFYLHVPRMLEIEVICFCLASWSASIGVYRTRPWGFWFFVTFACLCLMVEGAQILLHPETRNPGYIIDLVFGITGLIIVFRKKNRVLFFDQAMRWWERATRYSVTLPVDLKQATDHVGGTIVNLSETGFFVETTAQMPIASTARAEFMVGARSYVFTARVTRHGINPAGLGFAFDVGSKAEAREFSRALNQEFKSKKIAPGQNASTVRRA